MLNANGDEFPDPPSDPIELARWKKIYFGQLYGASSETIRQWFAVSDQRQRDRRLRRYTWILRGLMGATLLSLANSYLWPSLWALALLLISSLSLLCALMIPPEY